MIATRKLGITILFVSVDFDPQNSFVLERVNELAGGRSEEYKRHTTKAGEVEKVRFKARALLISSEVNSVDTRTSGNSSYDRYNRSTQLQVSQTSSGFPGPAATEFFLTSPPGPLARRHRSGATKPWYLPEEVMAANPR